MEKPIKLKKDRSGSNPTYRYKGMQVEVLPYFLYEVTAYRHDKEVTICLKSRMFKSNKFLNIKKTETVKKFADCIIIRSVNLIGAPYSFIKEMNLPIYKLYSKTNKK